MMIILLQRLNILLYFFDLLFCLVDLSVNCGDLSVVDGVGLFVAVFEALRRDFTGGRQKRVVWLERGPFVWLGGLLRRSVALRRVVQI